MIAKEGCSLPESPTVEVDLRDGKVDSTNTLIVNNRLAGLDYGITMTGNPTAKYRDNLTIGVTLPYQGGTNAGNNN